MTGHLMGAAGAVEGVFTVLSVHHQVAPATLNYEEPDPEIELAVVHGASREMEIRLRAVGQHRAGWAQRRGHLQAVRRRLSRPSRAGHAATGVRSGAGSEGVRPADRPRYRSCISTIRKVPPGLDHAPTARPPVLVDPGTVAHEPPSFVVRLMKPSPPDPRGRRRSRSRRRRSASLISAFEAKAATSDGNGTSSSTSAARKLSPPFRLMRATRSAFFSVGEHHAVAIGAQDRAEGRLGQGGDRHGGQRGHWEVRPGADVEALVPRIVAPEPGDTDAVLGRGDTDPLGHGRRAEVERQLGRVVSLGWKITPRV